MIRPFSAKRILRSFTAVFINTVTKNEAASPQPNTPLDRNNFLVSERLNGIVKNELLLTDPLDDFEHAVEMTTRAVHIYNTPRRLHHSCNMLTPQQLLDKFLSRNNVPDPQCSIIPSKTGKIKFITKEVSRYPVNGDRKRNIIKYVL